MLATDALGNRARKVNEILLDAEPRKGALLAAVDEVSKLSLLFVDQDRIKQLAEQMRAKIAGAHAPNDSPI